MVELGTNVDELSEKIGMDRTTFYRRLSADGQTFLIKEADAISKELGMTREEVNEIFLVNLSHNMRIKGGRMNEIKIFNSEEFGDIRTVQLNNETYFVGKDVATALGYAYTFGALKKHIMDEDKLVCQIDSAGQKRDVTVINESGLYALIFGSKLESAKRFKHWVTSEVLPAIRKTGSYQMSKPEGKELLAMAVLEAQKTIEQQSNEIERMKPKEIFADAVSTSHTSILIGDLAKLLKQNGVETGQKRLFEWLRENSYLIKRKGADWNMPTQKAMELGLFEVKESTVNNPDGSVRINKTTKVTGKGQQYFINKFLA